MVLPNIKLSVVSILLYYFRISKNYYIVINFLIELFLGEGFILICKAEMRILITKQPKAVANYFLKVEVLHVNHKIEKKLNDLQDN